MKEATVMCVNVSVWRSPGRSEGNHRNSEIWQADFGQISKRKLLNMLQLCYSTVSLCVCTGNRSMSIM
jgi:hypothetical protein